MRYILLLSLFVSCLVKAQTISLTINTKAEDIDTNLTTHIYFKELSQHKIIKEYFENKENTLSYNLKKNYQNLLIEITATDFKKDSIIILNIDKKGSYSFNIELVKDNIELLDEVIIEAKKSIIIKKDTVVFDVSKFTNAFDKKIEDVLKKMPGIEVNERTGTIKYKGKPVETVTLDGDNLFGYNYVLGTKNINLSIVEKVEAINNYSENSLLKGIESNNKVSLNLKLKENKTNISGDLEGSLGFNNNAQLETNNQANLLSIAKKNKTFGVISHNTIGKNNTPYGAYKEANNFNPNSNQDFYARQYINKPFTNTLLEDDLVFENNLLYGSALNLYKLKKNIVLRSSVFYLRDQLNYLQNTTTENTAENVTILTSDNENVNTNPTFLNGALKLEYNTSKSSFLEIYTFISYDNEKTHVNTLTNQLNSFNGSIETTNFFVKNTLDFTKKINKTNAFLFKINQSFNNIPQTLANTNTNFLTNNFFQESNDETNFFDASFSFLGRKKKLKYFLSVNHNFKKNNFFSETLLDQNTSVNVNQPTYHKNASIIDLSIDYKLKNWDFINKFEYHYLIQKLDSNRTNNFYSLNAKDQFINIDSKAIYNFNHYTNLEIGVERLKQTAVDNFIFNNPILTNQRFAVQNNPTLNLQSKNSYYLKHQNLIPKYRISFDISASYSLNRGYFIPNYTISENNTLITNQFFDEDYSNLNVIINLNKYLSFLNSTLKYNFSYFNYRYNNFFNTNQLRENESGKFENTISFLSSFSGKFNIENHSQMEYFTNNSNLSNQINNTQITNNFIIKYQPFKDLKLNWENRWYIPNTNNLKNNFLFSNIELTFAPKQKNKSYKLLINNLFKVTDFTVIQTSDFSINTISNNIVPRYFLFSFTYDL